ncbi:hypothetical protein ONZ43_g1841 [Nemania bipapillata]|uniref:Uncharacterized protein n=1 Tax=Nemania bipapillata TaxID=110536 RepID=A0ACC2J2Z0_9PEZI|nr:hypothetical protein ONZ43_g1841 [Nemania bipapillata]
MAAQTGNQNACFELIRRGASITAVTPITTGTPLLYAIRNKLSELTDQLLRGGADPNQPGTFFDRNKPSTPLLIAIERWDLGVIHRLVAAGARVDDQDMEGFSPIHIAATVGDADSDEEKKIRAEILSVLIHQYHAKVNGPRLLNGSQPIHFAASQGTVESVRILLDAGADINAVNDAGRTPLHWAAERGKWDIVELLLDRGVDAAIKSTEEDLRTPLELALAARAEPIWKVREIEGWDDARIDALLTRLESVAMN